MDIGQVKKKLKSRNLPMIMLDIVSWIIVGWDDVDGFCYSIIDYISDYQKISESSSTDWNRFTFKPICKLKVKCSLYENTLNCMKTFGQLKPSHSGGDWQHRGVWRSCQPRAKAASRWSRSRCLGTLDVLLRPAPPSTFSCCYWSAGRCTRRRRWEVWASSPPTPPPLAEGWTSSPSSSRCPWSWKTLQLCFISWKAYRMKRWAWSSIATFTFLSHSAYLAHSES